MNVRIALRQRLLADRQRTSAAILRSTSIVLSQKQIYPSGYL